MISLLKRGSFILLSILVFEMIIVADNSILYASTQEKIEKGEEKINFVLEWGSEGSDEGEFKKFFWECVCYRYRK
jgi:hypothetical protein